MLRAVAWFGLAVVAWSLNIRWGVDPNVPTGPPAQWQRHVVGAGLLALIAAIAISASGRGDTPPSNRARAIAVGSALLIMVLALVIRNSATSAGFEHLLQGSGFMWLFSGGGLVLGAAIGTFGLRVPERAGKSDRDGAGSRANRKRKGKGKSASRGKSAKKNRARK